MLNAYETAGHSAANPGLRGHSCGELYPWAVVVVEENEVRSYRAENLRTGATLGEFESWAAAEAAIGEIRKLNAERPVVRLPDPAAELFAVELPVEHIDMPEPKPADVPVEHIDMPVEPADVYLWRVVRAAMAARLALHSFVTAASVEAVRC